MSIETVRMTVTGMTCGGCENAVTRTLMKMAGVESVSALHRESLVTAVYDPDQVTLAAMKSAINAIGYSASAA